ncbi:MAG: SRPBCC domain-containing protein [Verrucomicrobia bacterium]|jgi:uncharacterized protein YndB with AHSA1/START domain|nr:SRPBCC domain-containing protein [Verrucomicrobiota bacterium]
MENLNEPVIVEETYDASPELVWEAITEADLMREWYFDTIKQFEAKVGFETCFEVTCEEVVYPHRWQVTEVVPGKRLVYRWRYDGYPGDSYVTWELFPESTGTKLKLTHKGHETFPQDNPVFGEDACLDAWHYFIQQTLPEYLEASGNE